jgi:hypothetical protein
MPIGLKLLIAVRAGPRPLLGRGITEFLDVTRERAQFEEREHRTHKDRDDEGQRNDRQKRVHCVLLSGRRIALRSDHGNVLAARGHVILKDAMVPPGGSAPRGEFLAMTVDPQSIDPNTGKAEVLDFGVLRPDEFHNLINLGPSTHPRLPSK